jgi:hypothetical protein
VDVPPDLRQARVTIVGHSGGGGGYCYIFNLRVPTVV